MLLRRTCLVVDDDPAMRRLVRSILERNGFQVLEGQNGVQALRLAEKLGDALDLIVSDLEMPEGDGLTFVFAVRQSYPSMPIVLMSGSAASTHRDNPKTVFEFLQKPFTATQLLERIQHASNPGGSKAQADGA